MLTLTAYLMTRKGQTKAPEDVRATGAKMRKEDPGVKGKSEGGKIVKMTSPWLSEGGYSKLFPAVPDADHGAKMRNEDPGAKGKSEGGKIVKMTSPWLSEGGYSKLFPAVPDADHGAKKKKKDPGTKAKKVGGKIAKVSSPELSEDSIGKLSPAVPDTATGRGKKKTVTDVRQFKYFTSIWSNFNGNVRVVRESVFFVMVTGKPKVVPHIRTRIIMGELFVDIAQDANLPDGYKADIIIGAGGCIEEFHHIGKGNLTIEEFTASEVTIHLGGPGLIEACLDAETTIVSVTGSGNVRLSGTTVKAKFHLEHTGSVWADQLLARAAEVRGAGSGNVTACVRDRLQLESTGCGNVSINGNPSVTGIIGAPVANMP